MTTTLDTNHLRLKDILHAARSSVEDNPYPFCNSLESRMGKEYDLEEVLEAFDREIDRSDALDELLNATDMEYGWVCDDEERCGVSYECEFHASIRKIEAIRARFPLETKQ